MEDPGKPPTKRVRPVSAMPMEGKHPLLQPCTETASKVTSSTVRNIQSVIAALVTGSRAEQAAALEAHYLPNASFQHPFCAVPSLTGLRLPWVGDVNSRQIMLLVYRWYKVLSPRIEFAVESVAYDGEHNILYVGLTQIFAIWFLPFHRARVHFVVVLHLVPAPPEPLSASTSPGTSPTPDSALSSTPTLQGGQVADLARDGAVPLLLRKTKYMIARQEDHYQINEFIKFVLPWLGLGPALVLAWQLVNTLLSILGAWSGSLLGL